MKFWQRINTRKILSFPAFFWRAFSALIIVALVGFGIRLVLAEHTTKTIFIFPTHVVGTGWSNKDAVLLQSLSGKAIEGDFTEENSAFVKFGRSAAEAPVEIISEPILESSASSTDMAVPDTDIPTNTGTDTPSAPALDTQPSLETSTEDAVFPSAFLWKEIFRNAFAEELPSEEELLDASSSSDLPSSTTEPIIINAGTPPGAESEPNIREDDAHAVPVCEIKGRPCHTLELSGFGIGEGIDLGVIKNVQLRLSLSSRGGGDSSLADVRDLLFVKYLYKDRWYLADTIVLDKDISNAENGGHFLYALPEVSTFSDLDDIKVSIEYDRNTDTERETSVDGAWLDVAYKTPNDEGEAPTPTENVSDSLQSLDESNNPDILAVSAQNKILFTSADSISSKGLVMKSDKRELSALLGGKIYFNVTNTTEEEARFALKAYFPESGGEVKRLRKWTKNVPFDMSVSEYRPLTFFCEDSWRVASSTGDDVRYECPSTAEAEKCDELNIDGTNCTQNIARIASRTDVGYRNMWTDVLVEENSSPSYLQGLEKLFKKISGDSLLPRAPFRSNQSLEGNYDIFPGQTLYFEMEVGYPINSRGKFFIEAAGGNDAYGLLRARWQSGWKYRMPITLGNTQSENLSEQEVYIELDESAAGMWENVKEDGSDIRFVSNQSGILANADLPYFVSFWDYENKRAGIWVQADALPASGASTVYLYYGNESAQSRSDARAPFTHSSARSIFRAKSDANSGAVVSLVDGNIVELPDGKKVPLDRSETANIGRIAASSVVLATGPLMAFGEAGGKNAFTPVSSTWGFHPQVERKEFSAEYALPEDAASVKISCSGENKTVHLSLFDPQETLGGDSVSGECSDEEDVVFTPDDAANFSAGTVISSVDEPPVSFRASYIRVVSSEEIELFGAPQARGSDAAVSVSFGEEEDSPVPSNIDDNLTDLDPLDASLDEYGLGETFEYPEKNDLLDVRQDFKAEDEPEFRFRYKSQRNPLVRFVRQNFADKQFLIKGVRMVHPGLGDVTVPFEVTYGEDGEWTLKLKKNGTPLHPGKYILKIDIDEGGKVFTDEMNFYWGVLAINTNKSIFTSGEDAYIQMAALSQNGNTLCDANLKLTLTKPDGTAYDVPVEKSGLCQGNNVVDVPDYFAHYLVDAIGTYTLKLSRFDEFGNFIAKITSTFEVRESVPFEIERIGPTRIYPPAPYSMMIRVKANEDFSGDIQEMLPVGFVLTDSDADKMTTQDAGVEQVWNVHLTVGETKTLRYSFDAPDVSPYLYVLQPLQFLKANNVSTSTQIFEEARGWQIASDATGNMIVLWDGGAAPAGWSCVSCGSGDFFQKFMRGAAAYATTSLGAATHTHAASGAVAANATGSRNNDGGTNISSTAHQHTYAPVIGSGSNLPSYRQLRVIRYDSAGEPATIPAGAILIFDAAVPSGWTQVSAQDNFYAYGENTVGTTGGSNTHTHTITGDTDTAFGGTVSASNNNPRGSAAPPTHTHTINSATASTSNEPAYLTVILGKLTSATTTQNNYITMWDNTPEAGWVVLSDVGGPLYQKFIKPSATYGTTGGSDSHAPTDVLGIVSGGSNTTQTNRNNGTAANTNVHTHSVDVTGFSSDASLPPYNDVIFAKRLAGIPQFAQNQYYWYVNANANTPTDPWPAGTGDVGEDAPITVADVPPGPASVLRLRMSLTSNNATTTAGTQDFKLQYGEGATCSDISAWVDVGAAGSGAVWRGYGNAAVADGATLSTTLLSLSNVVESYEEENNSVTNPTEIGKLQNGEWDWVIEDNTATSSTNYCFRMAKSDGTALSSYGGYPALVTNAAPDATTLSAPFDNQKAASTSPWFEFFAADPEANDLNYQIQVDDNSDFSSTVLDKNTTSDPTLFQNLIAPSDKDPYNSGNLIRFIPTTSLTNGTTYWWRIRAKDPSGSNTWGAWATGYSFTVDTSITLSTWYQTTQAQFATDVLNGTRASTTNSIELTPPNTSGSATSTSVSFSSGQSTAATAWGALSWSNTKPGGSQITYQMEYFTSTSSWALIPDADLSGNGSGFTTSPVNLLGLDETVYATVRVRANFSTSGNSPTLDDWTLTWGSRVSTPTQTKLFDNEKTATTTPTFEFSSTDPQSEDLEYQVSWSTSPTFSASTTRSSNVHAGFSNFTTPADTDPFTSGDTIRFTIQAADALTNGTTYWWRVRARDPAGSNTYSLWSDTRSFTVDTTIGVSTWFQTTSEQFDTGTYTNAYANSNAVTVSATASAAFIAYAEGAVQTPRYRIWNGTSLGSELSAQSVGAQIKWIVLKENPQRDEYVLATIGTNGAVKAQVYKNSAWGNLQTIANSVSNTSARGVDVVFEETTGDAVVAACDGDPDPTYYKWNGTSWYASGTINVTSANNCEWIKMASDPASGSNEIIAMVRDTGATYEAQVWSGSVWGNGATFGAMTETSHEGIGLEYEDSGGQAVALSSNGNTGGIVWRSWNGSAWSPVPGSAPTGRTFPNSGGDDFEWGTLKRDKGTDNMALCYIDHDADIGAVLWDGSTFGTNIEHITIGNDKNGRPVDCDYETTTGRDGYLMEVYSDTANALYNSYNGAWAGGAALSTVQDSFTAQTRRTGDGTLLSLWFDDVNARYDFSYWNASLWSALQSIETIPSVTATPFGEPFMMAPANESLFGRLVSPAIEFSDGDGPFWDTASSTETKPAGSSLLYQIEYYSTSTGTWALIPDGDLPSNSTGTSSLPINIRPLNKVTYGEIR